MIFFPHIPKLAGYPFRTLATGLRKICGNSMALLVAPVVLPTLGTTFSQSAKVLAESSSNSQIRQKTLGNLGMIQKWIQCFRRPVCMSEEPINKVRCLRGINAQKALNIEYVYCDYCALLWCSCCSIFQSFIFVAVTIQQAWQSKVLLRCWRAACHQHWCIGRWSDPGQLAMSKLEELNSFETKKRATPRVPIHKRLKPRF